MPPNTKTLKGSGEEPKKDPRYVTKCPFCPLYDPDDTGAPEAGIIEKSRERCLASIGSVAVAVYDYSCALGRNECGFLDVYCDVKLLVKALRPNV